MRYAVLLAAALLLWWCADGMNEIAAERDACSSSGGLWTQKMECMP